MDRELAESGPAVEEPAAARRPRFLFRLGAIVGRVLLAAPLLATAVWATLALEIDVRTGWLGRSLAAAYAIASFALLLFVLPVGLNRFLRFGRALLLFAGCFGVVLGWWLTIQPSHDRLWLGEVAVLPRAAIDGDEVTIYDIRDFDYETETQYVPRYVTRTVRLSELEGMDTFLCHWGSPYISHPIVSFRFKDQDPIAFSIETRKELGESYSALRGFFRQYELIYVVGEERDLVRLRTNFREGEEAFLFRIVTPAERARAIFVEYLKRVNAIHETPEFYNALTSNCTTNIRIHTDSVDGDNARPFDWRYLLNGTLDRMAYERGSLDRSLPFEELRRRSNITEVSRGVTDLTRYSSIIREGLPGFR